MGGMTLYELTQNKAEFERLMEFGELDPQMVLDTLEGLTGEIEVKGTNVAKFIRNLECVAAAKREAGKQMFESAARIERRADSIRAYLLFNMEFSGLTRIECPEFTIAVRKNPASVIIDDEAALPPRFIVQPEPPAPRPDKAAIRDALKAGEAVPGARLVQSDRLEIKE